MQTIDDVKAAIEDLEEIQEETIRAKERLKMELKALKELGFDSIEDADEGLAVLTKKLEKKEAKFETDFENFVEDYEGKL